MKAVTTPWAFGGLTTARFRSTTTIAPRAIEKTYEKKSALVVVHPSQ